jgi:hypothetical protein
MTDKRIETEIRLPNGDILVAPSAERDPVADAAVKSALDEFRKRQQERMAAFRRTRGQAA